MSKFSLKDVGTLREQTGVGILAAKRALQESRGDIQKAIETLRKAGQSIAAGKTSRVTREGTIGYYIHANKKIAALVSLACETDFVARNEKFQELAHNLALHIAAAHPEYLQLEDIPHDVLVHEREIYGEQAKREGKPPAVLDKIVAGKLEKYYEEHCLLKQRFVKQDDLTIEDLITATIQKFGENIQIREFVRFTL
jgi:elongation factor Ts